MNQPWMELTKQMNEKFDWEAHLPNQIASDMWKMYVTEATI
jgi:hypothetical protein